MRKPNKQELQEKQSQPNSPTSYSLTNGKTKKQVRSATKQAMGMVIEAYRSLINVCSVFNSLGARQPLAVCLRKRGIRTVVFGLDSGRERCRAAEDGGELYE